MPNAIGIDLGTTSSCVAVFTHGRVEIIANEQGNRTTPSYVAFTERERHIGDAAKDQAAMNPSTTVFDVKRLIGRKFDDPAVQSDIKYWPFNVDNDGSKPKIIAQYKGKPKIFSPEEISAMVLLKMKRTAESFLGQPVKNAVITVPAYFNLAQRQATIDAGTIAGLHVLRIINETSAAAFAYGIHKNLENEQNVLMFDLGGGSCHASVITFESGIFEIKATAGDLHLGGEDFNNRLFNHFRAEFKAKHGKDLSQNPRASCRLRAACEKAKRALSTSARAAIELDALLDGTDFYTSITRTRFEELCDDLFRNAMEPVEKVLRDAKMGKSAIKEVILVGGSSRIPKVQQLLSGFFFGKELNRTINPDEAVAYGAAIQGAILSGEKCPLVHELLLLDATTISLGIESTPGVMSALIKRNSTLPTKTLQTFSRDVFSTNYKHDIVIQIFEGENAMTRDNNLLGRLQLFDVQPVSGKNSEIEITFSLTNEGFLEATAVDKATGNKNTINAPKANEDIEKMTREAAKYEADDAAEQERIQAKNNLESCVYNLKQLIEELGHNTLVDDRMSVDFKCDEALGWIDRNPDATKDDFDAQLRRLESLNLKGEELRQRFRRMQQGLESRRQQQQEDQQRQEELRQQREREEQRQREQREEQQRHQEQERQRRHQQEQQEQQEQQRRQQQGQQQQQQQELPRQEQMRQYQEYLRHQQQQQEQQLQELRRKQELVERLQQQQGQLDQLRQTQAQLQQLQQTWGQFTTSLGLNNTANQGPPSAPPPYDFSSGSSTNVNPASYSNYPPPYPTNNFGGPPTPTYYNDPYALAQLQAQQREQQRRTEAEQASRILLNALYQPQPQPQPDVTLLLWQLHLNDDE